MRISMACARRATLRPTFPRPTIPRILPSRSVPRSASDWYCLHLPARMSRSASRRRRARARIRASVCSAVLVVMTSRFGSDETGMPRWVAASTSTARDRISMIAMKRSGPASITSPSTGISPRAHRYSQPSTPAMSSSRVIVRSRRGKTSTVAIRRSRAIASPGTG